MGPVPRGKALFLRNLWALRPLDETVATLRRWGLSWALVDAEAPVAGLDALGEAARTAGLALWPFSWLPAPEEAEAAARRLVAVTERLGAPGYVINPERQWRDRAPEAWGFAEALDQIARLRGWGLGLTTYGYPSNLPDFPWEAFAGRGFGMPLVPQRYRDDRPLAERWARAEGEWRALGWSYLAPVFPAREADSLKTLPLLPAAALWPPGRHLPAGVTAQEIAAWRVRPAAWWRALDALNRAALAGDPFRAASARVGY